MNTINREDNERSEALKHIYDEIINTDDMIERFIVLSDMGLPAILGCYQEIEAYVEEHGGIDLTASGTSSSIGKLVAKALQPFGYVTEGPYQLGNEFKDAFFSSARVYTKKENPGLFLDKAIVKTVPEEIYHYTNITSLEGILKGELWLGNTYGMNDRNEIRGFVRRAEEEVLALCCGDAAYIEPCHEMFQRNQHITDLPGYVMSFSDLEDDAAQWERYADHGMGVAIAFRTEALRKLMYTTGSSSRGVHFSPSRIIYTEDLSSLDIISRIAKYLLGEEATPGENERDLFSELAKLAIFYKHPSFKQEREIRIAVPPLDPDLVASGLFHSPSRRGAREVYKVNWKDQGMEGRELISRIIIGPMSEADEGMITRYMREKSADWLEGHIQKSECPLK